jgi:hypothetical protein
MTKTTKIPGKIYRRPSRAASAICDQTQDISARCQPAPEYFFIKAEVLFWSLVRSQELQARQAHAKIALGHMSVIGSV